MTPDYEILPLTQEYIDMCNKWGEDIGVNENKAILKCFVRDGDLYRQMTSIIDKDIINTKEFVMLIYECLRACEWAIKEAKKQKL